MIFPQFFQLALLVLCIITTVLCVYDISKELEPEGELKVRLDYNLALTFPKDLPADTAPAPVRNWFWSSHIKFNQDVDSISDGQLWKMALDAYDEMVKGMEKYGIGSGGQPGAMTVMAFGKVILSSSQKGGSSFTYSLKETLVSKTLELCETLWKDRGKPKMTWKHKNRGKCGEIMAAHLYYIVNPHTPLTKENHRVGTVVLKSMNKVEKDVPCGNPDRDLWGCDRFVENHPLNYMDDNIALESYVLENLAGGPSGFGQIPICAASKSG